MPFDFVAYDKKCAALTAEELQREWQHYTRLITGAATSTTVSGLALPLTLGVSSVGIAMAAPAIHNARKKREIIERHLQRHDAHHVTRKRDVLGGAAVSGTIGVVTLGVGTMGADAVAQQGAEHGINAIVANETAIKVVTHAALDGVGMGVEHLHTDRVKKREAKKAFEKAGVFQAVQHAKAQEAGYPPPHMSVTHQHPYGLHALHTGASSSKQSVMSPPPPYNAPQGQSMPVQQPTKDQPTALNVPTYVAPEHQQYATLDAKIDPTIVEQQWTAQTAAMQYQPATAVYHQVSPPGNILSPPVPPKETRPPAPAMTFDQGNVGPGANDMDSLIANVEQQLKVTETAASSQAGHIPPMSYQASPIVDYYELDSSPDIITQQPAQSQVPNSTCAQPALSESAGTSSMSERTQNTSDPCQDQAVFHSPVTPSEYMVSGHTKVPSIQHSENFTQQTQVLSTEFVPPHQPDGPPILGPRPPIQFDPPRVAAALRPISPGQQSVSTDNLPVTPLSTGSSYYQQSHQSMAHVVQPTPIHNAPFLPQPYLPTPLTPPSLEPTPQMHYQQPANFPGSYTPSPVTSPPSQPPQHHQQYAGQHGTYFPPPPAPVVAPTPQPPHPPGTPPTPNPVMSKRRSIMAAVALKAQQTLAQHRTPSGSVYNQPQPPTHSPQPQGQTQSQYPAQQHMYQPQQQWPQQQQQTYSAPQCQQPQHTPEEPVYAPVPLPKAYSTQPQLPPTPISPPSIPTVQYAGQQQYQQHPGYFS